jgi:Helix-turn-helix domain
LSSRDTSVFLRKSACLAASLSCSAGKRHGKQAFFLYPEGAYTMTIHLEEHRVFDSAEELNEAIRLHLRKHRYKLNKTAFTVLETISRYAVKYGGAAWLKGRTLADLVGKSEPTVRRAVAFLEKLGILERVPQMRKKSGGNGANIIRILPPQKLNDHPEMIARKEVEYPCKAKVEAANSQKESTSFKSFNTSLKILRKETRLGYSFTPKNVPEPFIKTVKPFFYEAADIYQLWGKAMLAYKKFTLLHMLEDYTELVLDAFKQSIYAHKHRKIRKDFKGYFYGTLLKMFTYQKRRETFSSHPSIFNWLEDQEEKAAGSTKDWRTEIQELMAKEERDLDDWIEELPY